MKLLVTGGLGFIGSNLVRWILKHQPQVEILNIDGLTYAGNLANLADVADNPRYHWQRIMITDEEAVNAAFEAFKPDAVLHLAAESHVDRSIKAGLPFVATNVLGTQTLLEAARRHGVGRFVHVSTDEVYGSAVPPDRFRESHPVTPNSPYSASKAGSDLLALAAYTTYGQDVVVTRCSNNYGPYQYPEKLIPLFVTNGMLGKPWPLFGDGQNVRDWIFVEDHVRALWRVLEAGRSGEVYNIGADNEQSNRDVADRLCQLMGLSTDVIQPVADRLGHDRRYAIDASKMRNELGWEPQVTWAEGLASTVAWYRSHTEWWTPLREASR